MNLIIPMSLNEGKQTEFGKYLSIQESEWGWIWIISANQFASAQYLNTHEILN